MNRPAGPGTRLTRPSRTTYSPLRRAERFVPLIQAVLDVLAHAVGSGRRAWRKARVIDALRSGRRSQVATQVSEPVRKFLEKPNFAVLATRSDAAGLQATPMWFLYEG